MKRVLIALLAVGFLAVAPLEGEAAGQRGGLGGFLVGCCFGVRTAGEWNAGKDLHFRDWGRIIPFVSIVLAVWDGIDGAQGVQTADLQRSYGANYY